MAKYTDKPFADESTHLPRNKKDFALTYAENGFFVAPVSADGRVLGIATKKPERIAEHWTKWPDAGIGVHLGKSRLSVIEVKGEAADKLGDKMFPPTLMCASATGLRRYFYRCNKRWKVPGRRETLRGPTGEVAEIHALGGDVVVVVPCE